MAFAHYLLAVPAESSSSSLKPHHLNPIVASSSSKILPWKSPGVSFGLNLNKVCNFSIFPKLLHRIAAHKAKAKPQESEVSPAVDSFSQFKHLLLPITDRNPYLSEGTRQATSTAAALAKKYGAEITVVVIDGNQKETLPDHETQLSSIRWHLSEGGFTEYKLLERLGDGSKPTAIIGEIADEMSLDMVIMSMEAIHSKHVDANLLAEFIPCPVLLLPL
ncbi:hypothetical protein DCAR_0416909 [Daucus carota subsp. sativus]|uniref:Uncharacterized protein n=1 Tax=Daucus carota subsp. sativus TaxID=79200 RepID=A0A165XW98_DAUCS|nr:PREDICTED: uncharacterized protein LOC108216111 [Daucus carota subsp. sativus]WOG97568.1 hypothetical protein DCAR_0416909 [Daucus carota subsp. sativus]